MPQATFMLNMTEMPTTETSPRASPIGMRIAIRARAMTTPAIPTSRLLMTWPPKAGRGAPSKRLAHRYRTQQVADDGEQNAREPYRQRPARRPDQKSEIAHRLFGTLCRADGVGQGLPEQHPEKHEP